MFFLMSSCSCSNSTTEIACFNAVWDIPTPKNLGVVKMVGNHSDTFAVFAKLPKADFEFFRKTSSHYTTWTHLSDGMVFEIGKTELRTPYDISGIYAIGENVNGVIKVVIWDETSETVVAMMCSGIM